LANNTFGHIFQLHSFGESHGKAVGGVIDGCPAGFEVDFAHIQEALNRRKPGQSEYTTQRKEEDQVEFLSGIFEGKTLGSPIAFLIWNKDAQSKDYDKLKHVYRPNHADYTYEAKYGIRDYRGGGRSSARETLARVVAGAIAQQILNSIYKVHIQAYVSGIGSFQMKDFNKQYTTTEIESNPFRCPDEGLVKEIKPYYEALMQEGDTVGGNIYCKIRGLEAGIGSPVFYKLNARLADAMMGINAVKSFQMGTNTNVSAELGSNFNDAFVNANNEVSTQTNHSAGIQGGISNGQDIEFITGFKPVASIKKEQQSIDNKGNAVNIPRAVPIVEAMAAMVVLDEILKNKSVRV
jgi:chorismate synthase